MTSLRDFSIFMLEIFEPHLPQVTSTDIHDLICLKLLRIFFEFY